MNEVQLVISREITVWKAWIGFNVSHSFGVILFGVVYAYLALAHLETLLHSRFFVAVGAVFLLIYVLLARAYRFSVPFAGVAVAFFGYVAGITVAWV